MDQLSEGQHQKAGQIGRSLVAQRHAGVPERGNWSLVKEFVEVETGKRSDRRQLAAALMRLIQLVPIFVPHNHSRPRARWVH